MRWTAWAGRRSSTPDGAVRWTTWATVALAALGAGDAGAQAASETVEIPLRVEAGRILVTARGPGGEAVDFVLGLGNSWLTRSGEARIGPDRSGLTLGGVPVVLHGAQVLPELAVIDGGSTPPGVAGILGGETLSRFDVLVDVPRGRLLLKPVGRLVRWEGVELTNGVRVQVLHDYLVRTNVELGGQVFGALLDLAGPAMVASEPAARKAGVAPGRRDVRMGYSAFPALPLEVRPLPVFGAWDGAGAGFVLVGAPVALDCALAVSYAHAEIRTCVR